MSLKLRLARAGAKKRPFYKIVVADSRSPRDGRFIEKLGTFDPIVPKDSEKRLVVDVDRLKHWLSVGAIPTDRVLRFVAELGLGTRTNGNNPEKAKPKKKAQERAAKAAAAAPAEGAPSA